MLLMMLVECDVDVQESDEVVDDADVWRTSRDVSWKVQRLMMYVV